MNNYLKTLTLAFTITSFAFAEPGGYASNIGSGYASKNLQNPGYNMSPRMPNNYESNVGIEGLAKVMNNHERQNIDSNFYRNNSLTNTSNNFAVQPGNIPFENLNDVATLRNDLISALNIIRQMTKEKQDLIDENQKLETQYINQISLLNEEMNKRDNEAHKKESKLTKDKTEFEQLVKKLQANNNKLSDEKENLTKELNKKTEEIERLRKDNDEILERSNKSLEWANNELESLRESSDDFIEWCKINFEDTKKLIDLANSEKMENLMENAIKIVDSKDKDRTQKIINNTKKLIEVVKQLIDKNTENNPWTLIECHDFIQFFHVIITSLWHIHDINYEYIINNGTDAQQKEISDLTSQLQEQEEKLNNSSIYIDRSLERLTMLYTNYLQGNIHDNIEEHFFNLLEKARKDPSEAINLLDNIFYIAENVISKEKQISETIRLIAEKKGSISNSEIKQITDSIYNGSSDTEYSHSGAESHFDEHATGFTGKSSAPVQFSEHNSTGSALASSKNNTFKLSKDQDKYLRENAPEKYGILKNKLLSKKITRKEYDQAKTELYNKIKNNKKFNITKY